MYKVRRHLPLLILVCLPVLLFGVIKVTSERKARAAIETLIQEGEYEHHQHQHVVKSNLNIQISPLATTLRPSLSKGYEGRQRTVLVLPIEVVNRSPQTVEAVISHEWFGGRWPPTGLHVFMSDDNPAIRPVYRVGEKGSSVKPAILRSDESTQLDLHMDWPGTGSVRGGTLIPADQSGIYALRIVLFFESEGQKQYAVSPKMRITVVAPEAD